MSSANYSHCIPFLPVRDLHETIAFYKEKLGFHTEWFWGEPATDAGIGRDGLNLLFVKNPKFVDLLQQSDERLEICLFVSNVDEIFKELKSRQVEIVSELKNEPWLVREFSVLDCNGYLLRIGEGLENEPLETHSTVHNK
jgi:catechol 2,3-dioxygenase-like lactoylglutathione lyase family enzyme